jgi:hypothetical protein
MNTQKVSRDAAEADVTSWLDYKKVFDETREKYKEHGEVIIEAVMNGVLVLEKNTPDDKSLPFKWVHELQFPVGEGDAIKQLSY